jgi:hypothetical protein
MGIVDKNNGKKNNMTMALKARHFFPLLVFLIVYTLLIIPGTGMNRHYAVFFCQAGNYLYQDFSQGAYVRLSPQDDQGKNDISLFISRADWKKDGKLTGVTTEKASDRIGFLITAFFIALTLATPVSWKRKTTSLILGLLIITAYVMLKLRIIILYSYTQVPWFELYQNETTKQTISWWYHHFAAPATHGYAFVVIVWIALSIGRKEWQQINALISS